MAIDNIHHLINNYRTCSKCKQIDLVWLMDEQWVRDSLISGIRDMGMVLKTNGIKVETIVDMIMA